jgi:hypothetical protein
MSVPVNSSRLCSFSSEYSVVGEELSSTLDVSTFFFVSLSWHTR